MNFLNINKTVIKKILYAYTLVIFMVMPCAQAAFPLDGLKKFFSSLTGSQSNTNPNVNTDKTDSTNKSNVNSDSYISPQTAATVVKGSALVGVLGACGYGISQSRQACGAALGVLGLAGLATIVQALRHTYNLNAYYKEYILDEKNIGNFLININGYRYPADISRADGEFVKKLCDYSRKAGWKLVDLREHIKHEREIVQQKLCELAEYTDAPQKMVDWLKHYVSNLPCLDQALNDAWDIDICLKYMQHMAIQSVTSAQSGSINLTGSGSHSWPGEATSFTVSFNEEFWTELTKVIYVESWINLLCPDDKKKENKPSLFQRIKNELLLMNYWRPWKWSLMPRYHKATGLFQDLLLRYVRLCAMEGIVDQPSFVIEYQEVKNFVSTKIAMLADVVWLQDNLLQDMSSVAQVTWLAKLYKLSEQSTSLIKFAEAGQTMNNITTHINTLMISVVKDINDLQKHTNIKSNLAIITTNLNGLREKPYHPN